MHILIAALITSASLYSTSIFAAGYINITKTDIYCAEEQTKPDDADGKTKGKKKTGQAEDEEPECD